MSDLVPFAQMARWQSARLVDGNNGTDVTNLPWQGSDGDSRGFVRLDTSVLENDQTTQVLRTHPKWVGNGTIKGWFPWMPMPNNAVFESEVGFLKGAQHTNGVTFQVWEHHIENGREVWNRIARLFKTYTGALTKIRADLTHLSGQQVALELRVDAGPDAAQDWACWSQPRVLASTKPAEMPTTIHLKTFRCPNPDEDTWGDEPYLFVLGIFADGTTVKLTELSKATVRIISPSRTHGNLTNKTFYKNNSVTIPASTGLIETTMKPIDGLGLELGKKMASAGIAVIAMEEDLTPDWIANKGRRVLVDAVKAELEKLIRTMQVPDEAAIQTLVGAVKNKVVDAMKKATLNSVDGFFSAVDPDDYVGSDFRLWSYEAIQQAGNAGLPFTLEFKGDGVRYIVEGRAYNG